MADDWMIEMWRSIEAEVARWWWVQELRPLPHADDPPSPGPASW